jgi:Uma2 family endonuclease
MSSATLLPRPASAAPIALGPRPKRWTAEEFHRAGDSGAFEHVRVMLIRGEILEMPVPNPPHSTSKALAEEVLRRVFSTGFVIRGENPLVLGRTTDPVPDLAVVAGSTRDYATAHPVTAVLVVEVADSSLDYDTTTKASLYASAGIADYWVVDLVNRRIIVFRDPQTDATQPFGARYATVTAHAPGQAVSPLAAPGSSVTVGEVMP